MCHHPPSPPPPLECVSSCADFSKCNNKRLYQICPCCLLLFLFTKHFPSFALCSSFFFSSLNEAKIFNCLLITFFFWSLKTFKWLILAVQFNKAYNVFSWNVHIHAIYIVFIRSPNKNTQIQNTYRQHSLRLTTLKHFRCGVLFSTEPEKTMNVSNSASEVTLDYLQGDTKYIVSVMAISSAGLGPSKSLLLKTVKSFPPGKNFYCYSIIYQVH